MVIDFKNRRVRERVRFDGFTWESPCEYLGDNMNPEGLKLVNEYWDAFVKGSSQDPQKREEFRDYVIWQQGLSFMGIGGKLKKFFVFWGLEASNAKSSQDRMKEEMLGPIFRKGGARTALFTADNKGRFSIKDSTHTSNLASFLPPTRLVIISETDPNYHLDTEMICRLTGGDSQRYRGSGASDKNQFDFTCQAVIEILTNPMVKMDTTSPAVTDRLVTIYCGTRFVSEPSKWDEHKKDPSVEARLKNEYLNEYFTVLINRAFKWAETWNGENIEPLKEPAVVEEANEKAVLNNEFKVTKFLEEAVTYVPTCSTKVGDLLEAYRKHYDPRKQTSETMFYKIIGAYLTSKGCAKVRGTRGSFVYTGMALKSDIEIKLLREEAAAKRSGGRSSYAFELNPNDSKVREYDEQLLKLKEQYKKKFDERVKEQLETDNQGLLRRLQMDQARFELDVQEKDRAEAGKKGAKCITEWRNEQPILTFFASNTEAFLACKQWWPANSETHVAVEALLKDQERQDVGAAEKRKRENLEMGPSKKDGVKHSETAISRAKKLMEGQPLALVEQKLDEEEAKKNGAFYDEKTRLWSVNSIEGLAACMKRWGADEFGIYEDILLVVKEGLV
jgi:hypothetical protein